MATDRFRDYLTVRNPERFDLNFLSLYEEISARTKTFRANARHVSDLAYGLDEKQKLDIYLPEGDLRDAPVLLHMHGGGFVEGDRIDYGFIAEEWVKRGVIVVVPSYRLCSDGHAMLDAVADTKTAILWTRRHIAEFGGDMAALVLTGHSAGAIMLGNVVADLCWLEADNVPASYLKAVAITSGVYNFPLDFNARNDILTSPEVKIAMSAMQHIGLLPAKIILAVGSLETGPKDDYVTSAKAFRDALDRAGAGVELIILPEHNHLDTAKIIGDPSSPMFQAIAPFVQAHADT